MDIKLFKKSPVFVGIRSESKRLMDFKLKASKTGSYLTIKAFHSGLKKNDGDYEIIVHLNKNEVKELANEVKNFLSED